MPERDPLLTYNRPNTDLLKDLRSSNVATYADGYIKWLKSPTMKAGFTPEVRTAVETSINQSIAPILRQNVLVSGDLYKLEQGLRVTGEVESVTDKDFIFGGFSLLQIKDDFALVAKLYDQNEILLREFSQLVMIDENTPLDQVFASYYALPELLTRLELEQDNRFQDLIADLGSLAADHINREKFTEATAEEKVAQLHAIEAQINEELGLVKGAMLTVSTPVFMGQYDGMDLSTEQSITRNPKNGLGRDGKPVEAFSPYGRFVRVVYIELEQFGDGIVDSIHESTWSRGAPSLEIRDDLLQATYYVPMDKAYPIEFGAKSRPWWPAWS